MPKDLHAALVLKVKPEAGLPVTSDLFNDLESSSHSQSTIAWLYLGKMNAIPCPYAAQLHNKSIMSYVTILRLQVSYTLMPTRYLNERYLILRLPSPLGQKQHLILQPLLLHSKQFPDQEPS